MQIKESIVTILSELKILYPSLVIYQNRPENLMGENGLEAPIITYEIANNILNACLDKTAGKQDTEITIDIWTNSSEEGEILLEKLEETMRENNWLITFSMDIPDPDGICHINSRFTY
jgi:hypothetical protein